MQAPDPAPTIAAWAPAHRRLHRSWSPSRRPAGGQAAQLLNRHWIITDANGKVQEVHGDGVVGEQPNIAPGGAHRYSSGAVLETPVGTMEGSYGMRAADGTAFRAPIPRFRLAVPGVLH